MLSCTMENDLFFGDYYGEIPDQLGLRGDGSQYLIGALITLSVLLIAWAFKSNNRVSIALPKIFMSSLHTDQKYKEFMRITSTASVLLIANYLIATFTLLFLLLNEQFSFELSLYISAALPFGLIFTQVAFSYVITVFTGANLPLLSATGNTLSGYQFFGGIFVLIAIIWSLNPELSSLMGIAFIGVLIVTQVVRLFKNSYLLLSAGVSWYYLMLYFCTLEILPLFVAYYVFRMNFTS
jgi:hypothetical protein